MTTVRLAPSKDVRADRLTAIRAQSRRGFGSESQVGRTHESHVAQARVHGGLPPRLPQGVGMFLDRDGQIRAWLADGGRMPFKS